jgi:CRP/FNR family transcriptional regulator, cyclic AMP receptor protein
MTHNKGKAKRQLRDESLVEAGALSGVELFRGLPRSCLRTLEKNSAAREFRPGYVFFRPGESGDALFLLEKGRVQTFRATDKKRLTIAELKAPAVFGEMACIGQGMYHCAAETVTASRIRMISRKDLEAVLDQAPVLTRRLLELVGERFVRVLRELDGAALRHLIPRMAAMLLERADGEFVRGISHRELAERLGVYRESATAALGELRNAGIVAVSRKQIRILARGRLERAARE